MQPVQHKLWFKYIIYKLFQLLLFKHIIMNCTVHTYIDSFEWRHICYKKDQFLLELSLEFTYVDVIKLVIKVVITVKLKL